jgi:hypothetical protein
MKRSLWIVFGTLLVVGISTGAVLQWRKVRGLETEIGALKDKQSDLEWELYITSTDADTDFVTPNVGVIQFLRHGYSIEFETVNYTQDGLYLSGHFGNPTNLTLSNLTLVLSARPYFTDELRKKWEKAQTPYFWPWPGDWDIGSGQTSVIPTIMPKTSFPFYVTIPNVKQTKESFHIAVTFSGERYNY